MPKTPVNRQYQREAHLPVESFNLPHGLYTGVTYRQIEYDDLQIPAYIAKQRGDDRKEYVREELDKWRQSLLVGFDDNKRIKRVYVPEGEGFAHNHARFGGSFPHLLTPLWNLHANKPRL